MYFVLDSESGSPSGSASKCVLEMRVLPQTTMFFTVTKHMQYIPQIDDLKELISFLVVS